MNNLKLKVCGMRDRQNILDVAMLLPDYLGFIFYSASPRFVGDDVEIPNLNPSIMKVGVFVQQDLKLILKKVKTYALDFVQLHGGESAGQCAELKSAGIKIIKVFSVDDSFDFSTTKEFEPVADYFLFDTKGKWYGGNSFPFNWEKLDEYNQKIPFFLSGGLDEQNVSLISELKNMNLHAIDLNSRVEIRPGLKDLTRIEKIMDVRREI